MERQIEFPFEAIFHHIVERSQLLKELAGEKAKEEMVEKWRSTNTVRTELLSRKDLVSKEEKGDKTTWRITNTVKTQSDFASNAYKCRFRKV